MLATTMIERVLRITACVIFFFLAFLIVELNFSYVNIVELNFSYVNIFTP